MTERLYFTDSYLTEFESEVASCASTDGGFEVSLAATAFYPTGGGQPHDLGTLGGRAVLDVIDREGAGIAHVVDGPLDPGARVRGVIDWRRRFDHMQQHSGQHMLSAAFESVCQARTASFHLGTASSTIDLNRALSAAEVAAGEEAANRIVWEDREVHLRFTSADEAAALALRKESEREGTLRLIEVPGFDLSACGGTHVARTGAIGIISVTGWEKFKGGTRVEFLCGGRALGRLREWRDVFSATSRVLSVLPEGLAAAIERLQGENKALGRTVRDLQGQMAVHVAAELVSAGARVAGDRIVVVQALDGWDATGLKNIASFAAASAGGLRGRVLHLHSRPGRGGAGLGVSVDASAVVKALSPASAARAAASPRWPRQAASSARSPRWSRPLASCSARSSLRLPLWPGGGLGDVVCEHLGIRFAEVLRQQFRESSRLREGLEVLVQGGGQLRTFGQCEGEERSLADREGDAELRMLGQIVKNHRGIAGERVGLALQQRLEGGVIGVHEDGSRARDGADQADGERSLNQGHASSLEIGRPGQSGGGLLNHQEAVRKAGSREGELALRSSVTVMVAVPI